MMTFWQANFICFAVLTVASQKLPTTDACSSSSSLSQSLKAAIPAVAKTTTPSTNGATTTTAGSGPWYRCRTQTGGRQCRQGHCGNDETKLTDTAGYGSESACNDIKLYHQCYNYKTDSTGFGTCQPDFIGCTGVDRKALTALSSDSTCKNYLATAQKYYFRCVNKTSSSPTCRPLICNCAFGETANPQTMIFNDVNKCANYVGS